MFGRMKHAHLTTLEGRGLHRTIFGCPEVSRFARTPEKKPGRPVPKESSMCPICMARIVATGAALGSSGAIAALFAMKLGRAFRMPAPPGDGALAALADTRPNLRRPVVRAARRAHARKTASEKTEG